MDDIIAKGAKVSEEEIRKHMEWLREESDERRRGI